MAAKSDDDMPVMSSRLPIPPEDSAEIESPEDRSRILSTPWTQAIIDVLSFLDIEEPHSVEADKDGTQLAEFLIEHADLSAAIDAKRGELKNASGVDVQVTYFKNWAGTRRGLVLYARPTYIRHVKTLVEACGKLGIKVGCGGSYHTWAPLYPDASTTEQFCLLISNRDLVLEFQLGQILPRRIEYDNDKQEVTISPGVTTGELLKVFMKEGVCFKTNVIAQNFTYGGLLATGSHGTGRDQPIMSDWITSMKLVGPGGKVRTFPKDFEDDVILPQGVTVKDAMNALRVHLGVFGVVVEITLKVQPMESSEVRHFYPKLGELFYGRNPTIQSIVKEHWSVQLLWFPFNSLDLVGGLVQGLPHTDIWQPHLDEVWLHTVDLVEEYTETNKWDRLQQKVVDTVQSVFAGELGSPLIGRYPFLVPAYLAAGFKMIKAANPADKPKLEELPYAIHFRYGLKYATVYDMEFAFPVSIDKPDGFKIFLDAIHIVVAEIEKAAKPGILPTKDFPLSSALDIRFIEKSECLLCPATAQAGDTSTHTAYIEILSFVGTKSYKDFFTKIGREWMKLGGAPHWAKQWSFLEDENEECDIYRHLRKYYGENMTTFKKVVQALNGDEKDIFLNKTMKKLLFEE